MSVLRFFQRPSSAPVGEAQSSASAARDRLKILLAHGGRPLWMDTAFFLVRRHPNVHLDISGIPPKTMLKYFPRLEEIAPRTLFGTDWPRGASGSRRRRHPMWSAPP